MNFTLLVSSCMLLITLVYYYKIVVLTSKSFGHSLFQSFHSDYTRPDMLEAFRDIEMFVVENNLKDIGCVYLKEKQKHTPTSHRLDKARRRILQWYEKIFIYSSLDLFKEDYLHYFPGKDRVLHMIQVVEPLALASCRFYNNPNCSETFSYLRNFYAIPERKSIKCVDQDQPLQKESEEPTGNKEEL